MHPCAAWKVAESADKPGPVRRSRAATVIPLGARSPVRSSSLPGPDAGSVMRSLFGLAPGGVCHAGLLPGSRCALTAPFHPCLPDCSDIGGIFLLHFPSTRAAQVLPGTVPCGARTFLGTPPCDVMTRLPGRLRRGHCRTRVTRALQRSGSPVSRGSSSRRRPPCSSQAAYWPPGYIDTPACSPLRPST